MTLPSGSTSSCVSYNCNLFYQVYHTPFSLDDTDLTERSLRMCTTGRQAHQTPLVSRRRQLLTRLLPLDFPCTSSSPTLQASKLIRVGSTSPSVYVVFPSIIASDGCELIGSTYADITTSFAPGALSTIRPTDNSTYAFNFADLPCPPASVGWDGVGAYQPRLAPPPFLFGLDKAFATCIPGASQGIDPFGALQTANGISPPRQRRAMAHRRAEPWAPEKTPGPG